MARQQARRELGVEQTGGFKSKCPSLLRPRPASACVPGACIPVSLTLESALGTSMFEWICSIYVLSLSVCLDPVRPQDTVKAAHFLGAQTRSIEGEMARSLRGESCRLDPGCGRVRQPGPCREGGSESAVWGVGREADRGCQGDRRSRSLNSVGRVAVSQAWRSGGCGDWSLWQREQLTQRPECGQV